MEILCRLAAFLLRRRLVWLRDHDGEVNLRIAREGAFGLECNRMGLAWTRCWLEPDGSVKGPSYVESWKPYNTALTGAEGRSPKASG